VATAPAETSACPPIRCALSKAPNRCSILSFHLETTRQSQQSHLNQDDSIRSIIFQQHLQTLVHSARQASSPAASAWSATTCDITLDLADESARLAHWDALEYGVFCTFSLRHETHAVIFRLMSGGLRSPKDSRRAAAAEGRDIVGFDLTNLGDGHA
jgi:hypothetical protein